MKSITHGKDGRGVEVTHISKHGIWLVSRNHELFISFKEFPSFQDASVRKLMNVEQPTPNHLHWPDLGIDLAIESVRCFPLTSHPPRPTTRSGQQAKTERITQSKSGPRSAPIGTSPKGQSTSFPRIPHFPNPSNHVEVAEGDTAQSTD